MSGYLGRPPLLTVLDMLMEEDLANLPKTDGLLLMDEETAWRQLTGYLPREIECPYGCNRGAGERCPACV